MEDAPMARPDPFKVARRPQARAGTDIALARHRADASAAPPLFDGDWRLDVDALQRVVELAEAASEGRVYESGPGRTFFGSTSLVLDLAHAGLPTADDQVARRLVAAVEDDPRAGIVLRDRVYRELARLLGTDTPAHFELTVSARPDDSRVVILADFEAPLAPAAVADGQG
jgi:hypothetical protein